MEGDGQHVTIETTQGELRRLQGRGRAMLEAIAASKDPASGAQKVASIIQSAEEGFQRTEKLLQQLGKGGPLGGTPPSKGLASRIALIKERKASLEGHSSKQKAACASQWQGMHPSDVLQKIVDDALALTGCTIHTASADGTRSAASEASMVVLEVSRVLTAAIHLAGTGRPEAVHAAVMSPAEVAAGRSPWAGSQHQVFRRATEVALHALRHFTCSAQQAADDSAQGNTRSEAAQAVALQDFLYWLSSCRGLFQVPCQVTGQLLALDPSSQQLLPPVFRPFKIGSETLKLVAGGSMEPVALHMHALATS
ncbi:hypothetical protein CVIRNUC_004946 [Coccomyxa viridis]|uniref:Uncharacterized protein n=1 Tax=Coccomyxa viridis TaxID=1274662 RepID=A0AAV1I7G7_9CHLO|nr:hypothetical protein CVIRNUC_004946 [Coccomyxa viridis]